MPRRRARAVATQWHARPTTGPPTKFQLPEFPSRRARWGSTSDGGALRRLGERHDHAHARPADSCSPERPALVDGAADLQSRRMHPLAARRTAVMLAMGRTRLLVGANGARRLDHLLQLASRLRPDEGTGGAELRLFPHPLARSEHHAISGWVDRQADGAIDVETAARRLSRNNAAGPKPKGTSERTVGTSRPPASDAFEVDRNRSRP